MRLSLELVVIAIVILVVALVMLTIFGSTITGVVDITTARSQCAQTGGGSCRSVGQLPATWSVQSVYVRQADGSAVAKSCAEIMGCGQTPATATCGGCNFPTAPQLT